MRTLWAIESVVVILSFLGIDVIKVREMISKRKVKATCEQ